MRKISLSILIVFWAAAVAWSSDDALRQRAAFGDTGAQYDLAYALMMGNGTEVDYPAAMDWALRSASGGNTNANGLIGYMYYMGLGVTQDYVLAFHNYLLAATDDDPDMLMRLAFCYLRGHGVPPNAEVALELMERAVALGDAYAMFTLGMLHYEGSGLPMDWERAKVWFAKSVSAEHADGAVVLCRIYLSEGRDVEGLMWYTILTVLAPRRTAALDETMNAVLPDMTSAEQAEALARARDWLTEYARKQKASAALTEGNE